MAIIHEYHAPTICSLKLSLSDGFAVMRPDPLLPSTDTLESEVGEIPAIIPPDPISPGPSEPSGPVGTDTNLS